MRYGDNNPPSVAPPRPAPSAAALCNAFDKTDWRCPHCKYEYDNADSDYWLTEGEHEVTCDNCEKVYRVYVSVRYRYEVFV